MTYYNMAPDQRKILEEAPEIRLWYVKTDISIFELYFKTMKCSNKSLMLSTALLKSERRIQEIFVEENILPDTYRKFKHRLLKLSQREAIKETLINRQKIGESSKNWLDRISKFLPAFKDLDTALFFLKETSLYQKSKIEISKHLNSCESVSEMQNKIKYHIREEEVRENNLFFHQKIANKKKKHKRKEINYINNSNKTNENANRISLAIYRTHFEAIKDTGSELNIISEDLATDQGFKSYETPKVILKNIMGTMTEINKAVDLPVTLEDRLMHLTFLVVKTEDKKLVLIGNETISKIQQEKHEVQNLIKEFPKLFDLSPSKGFQGIMCNIETKGEKRVNIRQRRIPQAMQKGTKEIIDKMLKDGVIEVSTSSWCNPIRPVMKPNGEIRLTVNMQFLNNLVEDNEYTLPHIQRIYEKTQGHKWFTIIDLKDGYFQILVKPEDKHKTAFHFENQLYQFVRMPQGFKNSPAIFQQIMDMVLRDFIDNGCNVYLDDIVVYGKTKEDHDNMLKKVLFKLQENNFKINITKMQYKQKEVKLLGSIIDGITQKPIPEKQSKILTFQIPRTKKELQRFLGFANYYRKYLKNFATIAEPLYDLLRSKNEYLNWTEKEDKVFNLIKNMINSDIAVHLPDYSKEFVLSTDASNTGISAVLQQLIDNELKVIDWGSKRLSSAEKKYGITEKEFLALAWGVKHFDYFLRGRKFIIRTDHSALLSFKTKPIFGSLKLERMRESLQEYDCVIQYVKGEELIEADAISRIYEEPEDFTEFEKASRNFLTGKENEHFWKLKTGELKIIPYLKDRVAILKEIHEKLGHRGRDCMLKETIKTYYWPNLSEMINEIIKSCDNCAKNKQKSNGGEKFIESQGPNELAAADIFFVNQKNAFLTYIDYYTREAAIKKLRNKSASSIKKALEEVFMEKGAPKVIITDNGKEFVNNEVKELLESMLIAHHNISVEKHQSNGRIERFHRTLWQLLRKKIANEKNKYKNLEHILQELIQKYNNTYHSGIKSTPNEAKTNPDKMELKKMNSHESEYAKKFNPLYRECFELGERVFIQSPFLTAQEKINNRYESEGIIKEILDNDSYLVEILANSKTIKKNHSQLIKKF